MKLNFNLSIWKSDKFSLNSNVPVPGVFQFVILQHLHHQTEQFQLSKSLTNTRPRTMTKRNMRKWISRMPFLMISQPSFWEKFLWVGEIFLIHGSERSNSSHYRHPG